MITERHEVISQRRYITPTCSRRTGPNNPEGRRGGGRGTGGSGEGVARRSRLLVADQAVRPVVGDGDFDLVVTGAQRIGDVTAKWRAPEHAEIAVVDAHARQVDDLAEIELDAAVPRRARPPES